MIDLIDDQLDDQSDDQIDDQIDDQTDSPHMSLHNTPPTTPPETTTTLNATQRRQLYELVEELKKVEVPPYGNPLRDDTDILNDEDCLRIIEEDELEVQIFTVFFFVFFLDFLVNFSKELCVCIFFLGFCGERGYSVSIAFFF